MSLTGTNTAELRELIKQDIEDSRELQIQIDKLQYDLEQGNAPRDDNVLGPIESQSKKMSKELARRIEEIEDIPQKSASDREFLQALNARQVAWDRQILQIREMADLIYEARTRGYGEAADSLREEETDKEQLLSAPGPSAAVLETGSTGSEEAGSNTSECGSGSVADGPEEAVYDNELQQSNEDVGYDEDFVNYEADEEDIEPDKSKWPLCYRVLDIDPETDAASMSAACKK